MVPKHKGDLETTSKMKKIPNIKRSPTLEMTKMTTTLIMKTNPKTRTTSKMKMTPRNEA